MATQESSESITPIPIPFPDITTMHRDELKHYFLHSGHNSDTVNALITKELMRRVHEKVVEDAKALGMDKDAYDQMFETYSYETIPTMMSLLKEGKAKTVEEAHRMLFSKDATTEKPIDEINKAINALPSHRKHTRGEQLIKKDIAHHTNRIKAHIQEKNPWLTARQELAKNLKNKLF